MLLWFASALASVSLFSLLIDGPASFIFIFRIALFFALPVAFLYLPLIIRIPDAENGRFWAILVTGSLIGPLALILLKVIQQSPWDGDGPAPGVGATLIYAAIIGFFTALFYAFTLKLVSKYRK